MNNNDEMHELNHHHVLMTYDTKKSKNKELI